MTFAEPGVLGQYLAQLDGMLAQPFPEREVADAAGWGGPEYWVRVLRASQEFWEDHDGLARCEAEAELSAYCDALRAALAGRWGEPVDVELWPCLKAGCEGAVREPLDFLSQQLTSMLMWQLPGLGRWFGLGIGQQDKELPLELVAAVGSL
jgi:hypothetical protein